MSKGKDWTRDLESIRRQNVKLLKEREAYRDTVRDLRTKERNYQERLEELWAICTDVRMAITQVIDVAEDDGWSRLPEEVRTVVGWYVSECDLTREMYEKMEQFIKPSAWQRIVKSLQGKKD